jgi:hypothetical protein
MPAVQREPEQQVFSVVILGNFNPKIFHPLWYAQNELIAKQELDEAEDILSSSEVSMFNWNGIHFQIEQHRFGLTTKDAAQVPQLRDLAIGSFSLLEHTPLTALGFNLESRFQLPSRDAWKSVGHRLAPKQHWQSVLEDPGMISVAMLGKRNDCSADRISIRVAPASGLENGVVVSINQHYNIETEHRISTADRNNEVMRALKDDWKSFRNYAESAASILVFDGIEQVGTGS